MGWEGGREIERSKDSIIDYDLSLFMVLLPWPRMGLYLNSPMQSKVLSEPIVDLLLVILLSLNWIFGFVFEAQIWFSDYLS